MKTMFMHTINGKPAGFLGEQIVFASRSRKYQVPLAKSMAQIRRERRLSEKFRRTLGDQVPTFSYQHVTVAVP